jgi:glutamine cyclotransferase
MRFHWIMLTLLAATLSCRNGRGTTAAAQTTATKAAAVAPVKAQRCRIEVVKEYPHDPESYTQGLFFHEGKLFESTGQYGESSFREVDLVTGTAAFRIDYPKKYFAEGSVAFEGKIYVLTWTNRVAFVYDAATLEQIGTWKYPREGWGLTTDGKQLIASDGSARLFFMDGRLKTLRSLTVRLNGRPLKLLNELEYIDGKIWANVYTTDLIVIIDPATGNVDATVDCGGLLPGKLRTPETDVLNGIAVSEDGKIYLTGKNWPRLYEIKLKKK